MRPIRMYWKDVQIFAEFFYKGIISDIKGGFAYFSSGSTYKGFFNSIWKDIHNLFFRAKNRLYLSMFIVVLSHLVNGILIKLFAWTLFIYMYARYKWSTGEPMKFYRESYFSEELKR